MLTTNTQVLDVMAHPCSPIVGKAETEGSEFKASAVEVAAWLKVLVAHG